jgi:hypothetical protein
LPESQQGPVAYQHPTASSNLLPAFQAGIVFERVFQLFGSVELERTIPARSCRVGALHLHNGRERIRVCEIHQMNCFDDDVCLPGMSVWGHSCPGL